MKKFYFTLWFFWALRVVVCSLGGAVVVSSVITAVVYAREGFAVLDVAVVNAIMDIFTFWFLFSLNLTVLLALFRSVKFIFNKCRAGYSFQLLKCLNKNEFIEVIGYGDLVKFWRKWFMLLIWLTAAFMIIDFILFNYYNIYVLYGAVLLSGYFSFIFIGARCKQVRIVKC